MRFIHYSASRGHSLRKIEFALFVHAKFIQCLCEKVTSAERFLIDNFRINSSFIWKLLIYSMISNQSKVKYCWLKIPKLRVRGQRYTLLVNDDSVWSIQCKLSADIIPCLLWCAKRFCVIRHETFPVWLEYAKFGIVINPCTAELRYWQNTLHKLYPRCNCEEISATTIVSEVNYDISLNHSKSSSNISMLISLVTFGNVQHSLSKILSRHNSSVKAII